MSSSPLQIFQRQKGGATKTCWRNLKEEFNRELELEFEDKKIIKSSLTPSTPLNERDTNLKVADYSKIINEMKPICSIKKEVRREVSFTEEIIELEHPILESILLKVCDDAKDKQKIIVTSWLNFLKETKDAYQNCD
jgi:hypothetical protein